MRVVRRLVMLGCIVFALPSASAGQEHFDLLITGGRVIDGTGNPWFYADVGVREGRIVAVGPLSGATADRTLDASGKVVSPGFIDLHSHAGDQGRGPSARSLSDQDVRNRSAPNMIAQGVTTLVVNQDGRSPWPIRDQLGTYRDRGTGPNTAALVGHGQVRGMVMGDDFRRVASAEEVAAMQDLVRQAMEEGAYGMSAGHEYTPQIWSTTEEVVSLVSEVAPYHGVYVVHERSSGAEPMWWWPSQDPPGAPTMLDAVMETIEVAERTGVTSVQTHIKARGANFWGSGEAMIGLIQRARDRGVNIWADAYAYNTTGSDGRTVLIPPWVRRLASREGGGGVEVDYAATLRRLLDSPDSAAMIRRDVSHEMLRRGDAENILVLRHPDASFVGKTLRQLADEADVPAVEMALRLQLEGDPNQAGGARLRGFSLSEVDLENFYAQPWVATASDAGISMPGDGLTHPRFYGNFPRKIRRYALERGIVSVEGAIRSMTSLPAQILGLRDRGLIREGQRADIVVLDLETVRDKATALEPHQYPEGIDHVLVNGEFVIESGEHTWALPGQVITPSRAAATAQDVTLFRGATVVDGTGAPAVSADVRIQAGVIDAVGDLVPAPGERVVDATGLVLAPGFIDTHSHHDGGIFERPEALAAVSQGITTIVAGQDGGSRFPLADFFGRLESSPVAVNVASYVGHGRLRSEVLGDDYRRAATASETDLMRILLRRELEAGALGLSTGLEYDPGIYSETEEVVSLARETARVGGRYISHMRSEDRYLWDAVEEAILIGREARLPVQISHMKMAMKSLWGQADRLVARLDEARAQGVDITADVYPYEFWQSTMTVLFPEREYTREAATFALEELAPPEGLLIARFAPDPTYVGKTLADIAELRGVDAVTAYLDLIAEVQAMRRETGRGGESVIGTSMATEDVVRLLQWEHTNVSSDGGLAGRHPRGFGAFTRVLGRYARDEGYLSMAEAIHKMSGLAAEHMGMKDRGVIRAGAAADLVLFDPEAVVDHATPEEPGARSEGIVGVWVNGERVLDWGEPTGARPGRVIRRR